MKKKSTEKWISGRAFRMLCSFAHFPVKKYTPSYPDIDDDLEGPVLVLSNHVTNSDMFFLMDMFRRPVSFVGSEELLCKGFISRILDERIGVIPMFKGGLGVSTSRRIIKALKAGRMVAMFPEGRHSPDGRTGPVKKSTAALVKVCGCKVVCLNIDGFFVHPRWCTSARKGHVDIKVSRILSPEEIGNMSVEEICDALKHALFVDAYELHKDDGMQWEGKELAEHLEEEYFVCPSCGAFHSITSQGDGFMCTACGKKGTLDGRGAITGDIGVTDLRQMWDIQEERFYSYADEKDENDVIFDYGECGVSILDLKNRRTEKKGPMHLWTDRTCIHLGDKVMPYAAVPLISLRAGPTLLVEFEGNHYEVDLHGKSGAPFQLLSQAVRKNDWF